MTFFTIEKLFPDDDTNDSEKETEHIEKPTHQIELLEKNRNSDKKLSSDKTSQANFNKTRKCNTKSIALFQTIKVTL